MKIKSSHKLIICKFSGTLLAILLIVQFGQVISACSEKKGTSTINTSSETNLSKFTGIWTHKGISAKIPDDTLFIEDLGNGNASVRLVVFKESIIDPGYKIGRKSFSGTYNKDNDRIDLLNSHPIVFNQAKGSLNLVGEEWFKFQ